MNSIPTLDRQPKIVAEPKKIHFTDHALSLHKKCCTIITSIQIQQELMGDAINENDEWKQRHIAAKLDNLYAEYKETFFSLVQPIIDKVEE